MKFPSIILLSAFIVLGAFMSTSAQQDDDYFDETFLRYEDRVYHPSIRTVVFGIKGVRLSLPVIRLDGGEQLHLKFDDLRGDYHDFSYTLIHCDRNWQPSDIPPMEYLEGFLDVNVTDYQFSMNASQQYIHYSFSFPNRDMRLKLSGNYILLVYADFDKEQPVITRRFRVFEKLVEVEAQVRMPSEIAKRRTHHQINMTISHPGLDIRNPMGDISVHIQQNYRWDNMVTDLKPVFVRDGRLVYDNMGDLMFEGGNEFRWIDIRSLRYQDANVRTIWRDRDSLLTHVFLLDEKPLPKNQYVAMPDINGAFYIDFREGNYPDTESDYAMVHFRLMVETPFMNGGIYIFGGLSDWSIDPRFRMEYNYKAKAYEANMMLKQGYYNYQYIFLEDGQTAGTVEPIEASFFETRQIYTFYVYHRQMGQRYDRLIGHDIIGSRN